MSRKTHRNVAQVWRQRLERQARGRWSVAEFCRREGVSTPSFYHWRKRLGVLLGRDEQPNGARRTSEARFLPVEVPSSLLSAGVSIQLPGGAVVQLPRDASADIVAAAVGAAWMVDSQREAAPC
jgi:transposase-like protein